MKKINWFCIFTVIALVLPVVTGCDSPYSDTTPPVDTRIECSSVSAGAGDTTAAAELSSLSSMPCDNGAYIPSLLPVFLSWLTPFGRPPCGVLSLIWVTFSI